MALTVEDGTGLTNADTYLSEADADIYEDTKMLGTDTDVVAWNAATSAQKEVALRRATEWIDITFRERWKGRRNKEEQSLAWPRTNVVDSDGFSVDTDIVHQDVKDATAEMAVRAIVSDLFVIDSAPSGAIKRTRDKVGPLETEVEYAGSASQRKKYDQVERMVRHLLNSHAGRVAVNRS